MNSPIGQGLEEYVKTLVGLAGGYLRNPVRLPNVTCAVCTTPSDGSLLCDRCRRHSHTPGIADLVGPLSYVFEGEQSHFVMRQYKSPSPLVEHLAVVNLLMYLGGTLHSDCAERIVGFPITHWATVPSLPAKPGEHPFRRLAYHGRGEEVRLTAASQVEGDRRALNVDHFRADAVLPPDSHVLLMDDTWASGGHIQSAALALRKAGAHKVSIMPAARYIKPAWANNRAFIKTYLTNDFDPRVCPWTGATCPGS